MATKADKQARLAAVQKRRAAKLAGSSNSGGWLGHPNSLAALERHRATGWAAVSARMKQPRCTVRGCKSPRLNGATRCAAHGGILQNPSHPRAVQHLATYERHVEHQQARRTLQTVDAACVAQVVAVAMPGHRGVVPVRAALWVWRGVQAMRQGGAAWRDYVRRMPLVRVGRARSGYWEPSQ